MQQEFDEHAADAMEHLGHLIPAQREILGRAAPRYLEVSKMRPLHELEYQKEMQADVVGGYTAHSIPARTLARVAEVEEDPYKLYRERQTTAATVVIG